MSVLQNSKKHSFLKLTTVVHNKHILYIYVRTRKNKKYNFLKYVITNVVQNKNMFLERVALAYQIFTLLLIVLFFLCAEEIKKGWQILSLCVLSVPIFFYQMFRSFAICFTLHSFLNWVKKMLNKSTFVYCTYNPRCRKSTQACTVKPVNLPLLSHIAFSQNTTPEQSYLSLECPKIFYCELFENREKPL